MSFIESVMNYTGSAVLNYLLDNPYITHELLDTEEYAKNPLTSKELITYVRIKYGLSLSISYPELIAELMRYAREQSEMVGVADYEPSLDVRLVLTENSCIIQVTDNTYNTIVYLQVPSADNVELEYTDYFVYIASHSNSPGYSDYDTMQMIKAGISVENYRLFHNIELFMHPNHGLQIDPYKVYLQKKAWWDVYMQQFGYEPLPNLDTIIYRSDFRQLLYEVQSKIEECMEGEQGYNDAPLFERISKARDDLYLADCALQNLQRQMQDHEVLAAYESYKQQLENQ